MVITILILIPIMCVLTGYLVIKAYSLGLKHNYEIKHDIKPTDPIKEFYHPKDKQVDTISIVDEWLNGKAEGE